MYVIKRLDYQGGGYVSKPNMEKSYTNTVKDMKKYETLYDAEKDCCDNETPVPLDYVIDYN